MLVLLFNFSFLAKSFLKANDKFPVFKSDARNIGNSSLWVLVFMIFQNSQFLGFQRVAVNRGSDLSTKRESFKVCPLSFVSANFQHIFLHIF